MRFCLAFLVSCLLACGADPLGSDIDVSRIVISGPYDDIGYAFGVTLDRPEVGDTIYLHYVLYDKSGQVLDSDAVTEVQDKLIFDVSDTSIAGKSSVTEFAESLGATNIPIPIYLLKKGGTFTVTARLGDVVSNTLSITVF